MITKTGVWKREGKGGRKWSEKHKFEVNKVVKKDTNILINKDKIINCK